VGYCTPSSLGGRLAAGEKVVRIFGEEHAVKARIATMESYSAHADCSEIMDFLQMCNLNEVKKIFLVHGEASGFENLSKLLRKKTKGEVVVPEKGSEYEL
jgi:metallo-beta-lactamase family protein